MENDEIKILLRKNLEIARENNRLLRKIRRSNLYGNIARIIWWAVILGLPVLLYYYFLQPQVQQLTEIYSGVGQEIQGFRDLFDSLPFTGGGDAAQEGAEVAQ